MTGVLERAPFLITLTAPHFSVTNILPSGANANAVGIESPVATVSTSNPVAAHTYDVCIPKNTIKQHRKENIFSKKRWRIV
jgi:hypothetical protein